MLVDVAFYLLRRDLELLENRLHDLVVHQGVQEMFRVHLTPALVDRLAGGGLEQLFRLLTQIVRDLNLLAILTATRAASIRLATCSAL